MPSFNIIGLPVIEKKLFKGFYHIWAWQPSWSCDLDHLYKHLFPLPKEAPHKIFALIGQAVSVVKMFENGGHIPVYSPGQGQTTPWGQILFINSIIQSIYSFAASFPPLNDFVTV